MRKQKLFLLLAVIIAALLIEMNFRGSDSSEDSSTKKDVENTNEYTYGTFCANVDYYNPDTNTRSAYKLNVEVENHQVTKIYWPNGGWLDDSHFSPEELNSNGSCSFASDGGFEYNVQITGPECDFTNEVVHEDNRNFTEIKDYTICPDCGNSKSEEALLCVDCNAKTICPLCRKFKAPLQEYCFECTSENNIVYKCNVCGKEGDLLFNDNMTCGECLYKRSINNQYK